MVRIQKLLITPLLLFILISSGCDTFKQIKVDIKEGFKNAKLKGSENQLDEVNKESIDRKKEVTKVDPKKQLEKECKSKISYYVELLRKKVSSRATINLVDYKVFNNKEEALDYVDFWHSDTFESGTGAKEDLSKEISSYIFVGVVKADMGFVQIGTDFISGGSNLAITFPIVCVNNSIMEGSKYTLTERIA